MATAGGGKANSRSDSASKERPVWTKQGFPLTVAVFELPNSSNDGRPTFSVKLTRSYRRNEDSDWENTEFLGAADLLRGAKLLEAADVFVQSRLESDFSSSKGE